MSRKTQFPCGHTGYGKICDRCNEVQALLEQKRQHKKEWDAKFAQDPINLRALPNYVVHKARFVIDGLQNRQNYREFGGKRLRHNRLIISIPLTRDYRMICRDCGNILVPEAVLSHEEYNVRKPGG